MGVAIGIDSHKSSLAAAALDELGRVISVKDLDAAADGAIAVPLGAFLEIEMLLHPFRHIKIRIGVASSGDPSPENPAFGVSVPVVN